MKISSFLLFFCVILVVISSFLGCGKSSKTDSKSVDPVPVVQVISPKRRDLQNIYKTSGSLEALKAVELSGEVTGKLIKLYVDEGDKVHQGMVVAEIDDSTQKAQLAQAQANLMKVQADWERTKAGPRPQELSTAQQSLLEARSTYELASTDYIRAKNMYDQGVANRQELDTAETQLKVKRANFLRTEENLSMVKEGVRKEDRDAMRANLQEAQALVEYNRSQYAKTKIISPIDGVVTARYKQVGDMVSAQPITNVLRIEKINPIKAVLKIPQEDQFLVKMNQPVSLDLRDGNKYTGTINLISPAVDVQNRSVKVEALLPNNNNSLRPGLFVEGSILMETHKNTLVIPQNVLIRNAADSTFKVFVVKDDIVHLTPVKTGIQNDGQIEILSGITSDELIVSGGFEKISDGEKVSTKK